MTSRSTTSSRAIQYFSERVEDAAETVKGLVGGSGNGGVGAGRSAGGGAKYIDTSDDTIRALLDSDRDEVRLEGLKMVVALISKGRDAGGYFASVVKLSSNGNLEIRKLVYIVVRRYARRQPDVALLGINSFQRDLHDRNEVVRAMALRVLTGLRLRLAASVVQLAIGKCVRDSAFYVRRAAALALIKSRDVVPDAQDTFKGYLATLLNDRHPGVLAASVVAWSALFPTSFDLLHPHFRKLCFALVDMEQWEQREALQVLGLYARRCLPRPKEGEKMDRDTDLLLSKAEDLLCSPNAAVVTAAARLLIALAPASRHACVARPLLRLTNTTPPDVAYVALLSCLYVAQTSPSLLIPYVFDFVPRSSRGEPGFVTKLKLQIMVCLATPDNASMILSELMEQAKFNPSEPVTVVAVAQAGEWAKRCGESDARQRVKCIRELLRLVKDRRSRHGVVSCALAVIRRLVEQSNDGVSAAIVVRLAPLLFSHAAGTDSEASKKKLKLVGKGAVRAGAARASMYWLVGQYCRLCVTTTDDKGTEQQQQRTIAHAIGLDVLRRAALNFAREDADAKLQIITLSTKLFTFVPTLTDVPQAHLAVLASLHAYILQLGRYDAHFDIRDRARFAKALTDRFDVGLAKGETNGESKDEAEDAQLGGVVLRRNQVLHILFEGRNSLPSNQESKPVDQAEQPVWNTLSAAIGASRSLSIPDRFPDFFAEPWADADALPPTSVRDPPSGGTDVVAVAGGASMLPGESATGSGVASPAAGGSGTGTPLEGGDHLAGHAVRSKYHNLDAFLDGEEEVKVVQDDDNDDDDDDDDDVGDKSSEDESIGDDAYSDEEEEESEEEESSEEEDSDQDERPAGIAAAAATTTPSIAPPQEDNAWAQ